MKVKAYELMIFNFVYVNGEITLLDRIEFREEVIKRRLKNIVPIPLTEEWLVKFGKTDRGIMVQSSNYPDGDLYIDCDDTGKGYYLWNCSEGYRFGKVLKYVHQLQNLYFALTNEELKLKQ